MTITNATCKAVLPGNGSMGSPGNPFTFNFNNGYASGALSPATALSYFVLTYTAADGTQTPVTIGPGSSQAQVTLNAATAGSLWGMGGSIVYQPGGAPIPAGSTLTVLRSLPATQTTSLQNQSSYGQYASSVEQALDRTEMQIQQMLELYGRAIVVNVSDVDDPAPLPPAAQRANTALIFDSNGNPTVGTGASGGVISAAMAPVVSASTLALARENMGIDLSDFLEAANNLSDLADVGAARSFLDTAPYIATRTAAKALDTTKDTTLILTEEGRWGIFNWRTGDYSAQIAADTAEGIYLKADAIASTVGAWVRFTDGTITPEWFGLVGGGSADNAPAWAAMMSYVTASSEWGANIIWSAKQYYFASDITDTSKPVNHIGVFSGGAVTNNGTVWRFGASAKFIISQRRGGQYSGVTFFRATGVEGNYLVWFNEAQATGCTYISFDNCVFYGECSAATIRVTNVLAIRFTKCRIVNTYDGGGSTKVIYADGSHFGVVGDPRTGDNVDNVEFVQCLISGTQDGAQDLVFLDGKADSTKFVECALVFGRHGIVTDNTGAGTQIPGFVYFVGGGFENGGGNAVRLAQGDMINFSCFYASHDATSAIDVILALDTFTGVANFSGGLVRGGQRSGYRVEGGQITINGGKSANNSANASGIGYSVEILSTVTSVIINGLDCKPYPTGSDDQDYAIRNLKGAADVIIAASDLRGAGRTGSISGTSTGAGIGLNLVI